MEKWSRLQLDILNNLDVDTTFLNIDIPPTKKAQRISETISEISKQINLSISIEDTLQQTNKFKNIETEKPITKPKRPASLSPRMPQKIILKSDDNYKLPETNIINLDIKSPSEQQGNITALVITDCKIEYKSSELEMLENIMSALGIDSYELTSIFTLAEVRENIYKDPNEEQVQDIIKEVSKTIANLNPKTIILAGRMISQIFTNSNATVGELASQDYIFKYKSSSQETNLAKEIPVVIMPALDYLQRVPKEKGRIWKVLKEFFNKNKSKCLDTKKQDGIIEFSPFFFKKAQQIEQESNPEPWTTGNILSSLKSDSNFGYFKDGNLIAFLIYRIISDEAELLHIVCNKPQQGNGYAKKIVKELIAECEHRKVKVIFLEVRASNILAINFYEEMGFSNIAVRDKYYKNGENAIIMRYYI